MNSYLISFAVYFNDASGIDHLCFFANISIGNAIIMFILTEINMVILSYFMFSVILDFKRRYRKFEKMFFLVSQELFFTTVILLLHPGLIVQFHLFKIGRAHV